MNFVQQSSPFMNSNKAWSLLVTGLLLTGVGWTVGEGSNSNCCSWIVAWYCTGCFNSSVLDASCICCTASCRKSSGGGVVWSFHCLFWLQGFTVDLC